MASRNTAAGGPRRVAVLGGTGFVGRPTCRVLADQGHQVLVLARRDPGDLPAPVRVRPVDLVRTSVAELAAVLTEERIDTLINAAGGMWGLSAAQMVDANVTLTERAIAAAAVVPAGSSPRRLVQVGTVHEYGLVPIGTSMVEDGQPAPVNDYGKLKLRCTQAVTAASRRGLIDGVALRVGNVVGAGQPGVSLLGGVAAQLSDAVARGGPAVVRTGPLGSMRDFMNLADAVAAIVTAATIEHLPARLFNIGAGQASSARAMVRLLIEVSGVPAELAEAGGSGQPESTWQQMDIERARRLLGWSPRGDLGDGMKELWQHHISVTPC